MNFLARKHLVFVTIMIVLLLSCSLLAENLVEQPFPPNGAVQLFTKDKSIAPLEIKSSQGTYYLIKLVNIDTQKTALTVFAHGSSVIDINVPLGKYEFRYASGEKWFGYEHLFGPATLYYKADGIFDFKVENDYINGYTITLHTVTDGNLKTKSIKPSDF